MDLYAQNILDRYKHPFYKDKSIEPTTSRKEVNHSCGDTVTCQMALNKDSVTAYSFTGNGCAISMASADMLGDLVENMSEEEVLKLGKEDIYEVLGIEISLRRSKCALLPLLAIQNAILEHRKKDLRSWTDYHL